MDHTPNAAERLGHLEGRVGGLEGNLRELKELVTSGLGSLSSDLKARSQPPYTLMVSLAAVLFTALGFVGNAWKSPIETAIIRQDQDLRTMQNKMVSRDEHEVHWRMQEKDLDLLRARMGRTEDGLGKRIDRLEADRFKGG